FPVLLAILPISLITPSHPIPTLFPYTTLFRSKCQQFLRKEMQALQKKIIFCIQAAETTEYGNRKENNILQKFVRKFHEPLPSHEDRKSTRLNSSHVSNSYAVFCLKKKTNTSHH